MRKIVSCLVVCFMLLTTFTAFVSVSPTEAAKGNQPATFIANRFVKVGFDRDGLPLYPAKMFPWQTSSDMPVWGRPDAGYPMPNASQAVALYDSIHSEKWYHYSFNFPAIGKNSPYLGMDENAEPNLTDVVPVAWTDVYLSVQPDGGRSQEYDHWYVVLDSAGQIWFDPDGTFHDSRINPFTHPESPLYNESDENLLLEGTNEIGFTYIPTSNPYYDPYYNDAVCKRYGTDINGVFRYSIDPISNNNTQGPYIINDFHNLYGHTQCVVNENYPSYRSFANWQNMDQTGRRGDIDPRFALVFETDTRYGTRKWQIGWSDMVDYPPMRNIYDPSATYENRPNDQDAVS
ncbi:MAG: hypothetical protein PHX86_03445, partial [Caldisericia bacterium]|nr:hypothetical protein [Caldisericia bacterium]